LSKFKAGDFIACDSGLRWITCYSARLSKLHSHGSCYFL